MQEKEILVLTTLHTTLRENKEMASTSAYAPATADAPHFDSLQQYAQQHHAAPAAADVAACHAELLRQKITFGEELRAQREAFQTQLDDANAKLRFREADCRNLQAVVTVLGRKLDELTGVVADMRRQREREREGQRYPNSSLSASAASQHQPPSASAGESGGGFRRPRAGSIGSVASASTGVSYSAFGRTVSSASATNGGNGLGFASGGGGGGTTPRRAPSPSRSAVIGASAHSVQTATASQRRREEDLTAVGGAVSAPPPQHAYTLRAIVGGQQGDAAVGGGTVADGSVAVVDTTSAPAEGSIAIANGGATTPNRTAKPNPTALTVVVAAPSNASKAAVGGTILGSAPASPSASTNGNITQPRYQYVPMPSSTVGNAPPNATAIAGVAPTSPSYLSATASSAARRPQSPRSSSLVTAYRPIDAFGGGYGGSGAVGLRGPTPTRVAKGTPERVRAAPVPVRY